MKIASKLKSFGLFRAIELLLWLPIVLFIMALLPSRFVGESPMFAQLRNGMSQAQVKAILGSPEEQLNTRRHSKQAIQEWRYLYHGHFGLGWESAIAVDFDAHGQVCWYGDGGG